MFRESARTKLVAVVVGIILFAGLVSTLSREGLVALAAVMVGAVLFGGRWRGRAVVFLAIGVCATVGYFFVLAPLAARQRVTMADTSGRSSIWTVAWRVVEAHPVLGVGNDNFILVEDRYVNRPGAVQAIYIIGHPKVVHNAYLEALVDLGIPGLLTLLAVLAGSIGAGVRAAWMFERSGDREMELISRCVVLAIIAVLTGGRVRLVGVRQIPVAAARRLPAAVGDRASDDPAGRVVVILAALLRSRGARRIAWPSARADACG